LSRLCQGFGAIIALMSFTQNTSAQIITAALGVYPIALALQLLFRNNRNSYIHTLQKKRER
jgi:predicted membrane chloride channel (bestrophin family)